MLETVTNRFQVKFTLQPITIVLPFSFSQSIPQYLQIFGNCNLEKLCAPNLEEVQVEVCIGDNINQKFLDANLEKLVTGEFPFGSSDLGCYTGITPLDAPTVCRNTNTTISGVMFENFWNFIFRYAGGGGGNNLFSRLGCPSKACCKKTKKDWKKTRKTKWEQKAKKTKKTKADLAPRSAETHRQSSNHIT